MKPVDPIVGEAIEKWEAVRPQQPALLDRKTGELVDFLFMYRTRLPSAPLSQSGTDSCLVHQSGRAPMRSRGAITSHRARATIATQLYNAKEPLSLFELQEWLGHRSAQSTQCYAKISATKMARSYAQAGYFERNLRAIDVLVDQEVVRNGLADARRVEVLRSWPRLLHVRLLRPVPSPHGLCEVLILLPKTFCASSAAGRQSEPAAPAPGDSTSGSRTGGRR